MSAKTGRPTSEKWISTKLELSRLLGISRPTLDTYSTLPGFPDRRQGDGAWPLEQCRAFVATQLNRSEEKRALELQKLRDEVARGQVALMKEAGELIPVQWSKMLFAHLMISTRNIIQGADIPEGEKSKMTSAIESVDADAFIAQLKLEGVPAGDRNGE